MREKLSTCAAALDGVGGCETPPCGGLAVDPFPFAVAVKLEMVVAPL